MDPSERQPHDDRLMGYARKFTVVATTLAGIVIGGQVPEFAQQYRQRLGGAVDELAAVARNFDTDAAGEGMARDGALDRMARSPDPFTQRRGTSMAQSLRRFERLRAQGEDLERTDPVLRPLAVARVPDRQLLAGTWAAFEPALPIGRAGIVWSGIGALLMLALAGLLTSRRLWRRRDEIDVEPQARPPVRRA